MMERAKKPRPIASRRRSSIRGLQSDVTVWARSALSAVNERRDGTAVVVAGELAEEGYKFEMGRQPIS
jgi:hypothetical protein